MHACVPGCLRACMRGCLGGCEAGWLRGSVAAWLGGCVACGWADSWMFLCMHGWMDGWMDVCLHRLPLHQSFTRGQLMHLGSEVSLSRYMTHQSVFGSHILLYGSSFDSLHREEKGLIKIELEVTWHPSSKCASLPASPPARWYRGTDGHTDTYLHRPAPRVSIGNAHAVIFSILKFTFSLLQEYVAGLTYCTFQYR